MYNEGGADTSTWKWTDTAGTQQTALPECGVQCPTDPPAAIPGILIQEDWNGRRWDDSEVVYSCGPEKQFALDTADGNTKLTVMCRHDAGSGINVWKWEDPDDDETLHTGGLPECVSACNRDPKEAVDLANRTWTDGAFAVGSEAKYKCVNTTLSFKRNTIQAEITMTVSYTHLTLPTKA